MIHFQETAAARDISWNWARSSRKIGCGGMCMNASVEKAPFAWQPLTPGGVAAFAGTTFRQLLLVQFVMALLAGGVVIWFLHEAWFPTIEEAIRQLPPQGDIRAGRLDWIGDSPACLAEGRFLALAVDLDHEGKIRSPAQVQVEFGRTDCKVYSLLGYVQRSYPHKWTAAFNGTELGPWWGAWAPALLGIAGLLVVTGLMASWACLATIYTLPVWLLGFFTNRQCGLCQSWRLAGAALMPGALLMCGAMVLYGCGAFDLVRLAIAGAAHLVIGWVYLCLSPLRLPQHEMATSAKENPFR